MSDEFNYLSLNQENDQQEPLIQQDQVNNNDSSNFIDNIKTITNCETKIIPEGFGLMKNISNIPQVRMNHQMPKKMPKYLKDNKTMQFAN